MCSVIVGVNVKRVVGTGADGLFDICCFISLLGRSRWNSEMNVVMFEKRPQSFKIIDSLLFYSKSVNLRGELRLFITSNFRKDILKQFHDNQLAGHLGIRNGPCFISDIFKALCTKLKIPQVFTVPYRPRSNMAESLES